MPTIIPIPAFTDNYIWLIAEGDRAIVIDPGDAKPVLEYLKRSGLALEAIVATHHHLDHVGGNMALLAQHAVPVFGPAGETIPGRTRALREGDHVSPGLGLEFDVLDVPGHTAGHIAYTGMLDGAPAVFCGDTLFACGCGRLFEGTAAQMWSSLAKLQALPDDTQVYCAHEYTVANIRFARLVEPDNRALAERAQRASERRAQRLPTVPSRMGEERATNPFLRAALPHVKAAAAAYAGYPVDDAVTSFAVLREWKNRS